MTIMGFIQSFNFNPAREAHPGHHAHHAHKHHACGGVQSNRFTDACSLSPEAQLFQGMESLQQRFGAWMSSLTPGGPSLAQPQEMSRGQQTEVGPHSMKVDGQGNITVDTKPNEMSMGMFCGNTAMTARLSQQEAPLKFSNGTVELPNGEKRPYGNTGIIVVMADGRQFAAGRNSKDSNENIRYVAADKGQDIPVSPPGATTVLYLDQGGNVARQETR